MIADKLLSLLRNVKRTRAGHWIASCPTRDDKHPSMTIKELDDGRILIHDFGGDSAQETPKDRLTWLQGDKIELEIAEKLDNLVPVAEVKPFWDAMVASAKAFLDQQPERLAQLLEVTEGTEARRDLLANEFDEILMKLSRYEPAE